MKAIFLLVTAMLCGSLLTSAKDHTAYKVVTIASMKDLSVQGHPDRAGQYKYLREPNAVVTKSGTLLVAYGPHHTKGKNDRAHQDILLKRSSDSGQTWSENTLIADYGMDSVLPTVLVYDEEKDRVLFVYNIIFNDPERKESKPCQQFVIHSDDEGETWSKPHEILPDIGGICVFGGGNGFQVKYGPNKGRLIISGGVGGKVKYFYSDDHGQTWQTGTFVNKGRKEGTGSETADGTLLMYHRGMGFGLIENRSSDGGKTWTPPRKVCLDMWGQCNNSALSIQHKGRSLIILGGPIGPENADKLALESEAKKLIRGKEDSKQSARSNGAIFISMDGGKSFPVKTLVAPGWTFGYNALVHLPDGKVGFVFEGAYGGQSWQGVKRDHNTGVSLGIYMVIVDLDQALAQPLK
ncbi:exo-alpha-sialidase [Verrucomicrobiaceae bacterium N1E253]|uniref:exo-alpha-sialidase n=1 Tax=Oceaniferula marina TaxID=2748318 RepID=A0A851GB05_9BACT|nr:sialidase family protein [Oceaniferula marina]NWK54142.1 exo-alpha-sialidase [Oceaniferula marina]